MSDPGFRVAILGIGNELNGDDSAGNRVARKLCAALGSQPNLFIMDCGSLPENATGPLRKFLPQYILMVDAADLGLDAGEVQFVELDQVRGFSASSHSLPLSILAGFLADEFHCEVGLCCIQPQSLEFDTQPSEQVKRAIRQVTRMIKETLIDPSAGW